MRSETNSRTAVVRRRPDVSTVSKSNAVTVDVGKAEQPGLSHGAHSAYRQDDKQGRQNTSSILLEQGEFLLCEIVANFEDFEAN
jgi:hypothetical protein